MVQADDETVRVAIGTEADGYDTYSFDILADGTLACDFFDDIYKIAFDGNKVTYTTVTGEKEHDGTYTMTKTLTAEEIIKVFA